MPAACADAILRAGRQGLDAVDDLGRPVPLAARVRQLAREGVAAPFPPIAGAPCPCPTICPHNRIPTMAGPIGFAARRKSRCRYGRR